MKSMKNNTLQQIVFSSVWQWISLVVPLIAFCFVVFSCLPGLQGITAAETVQDANIAAGKLQIEGTQLQLKGDLQGAAQKYRESLALKPNPVLQTLVERLETHIDNTKQDSGLETAATGEQVSTKSNTSGIWPLLNITSETSVHFRGMDYIGKVGASGTVAFQAKNVMTEDAPPLITDVTIFPSADGKTIEKLIITHVDDNAQMARINSTLLI